MASDDLRDVFSGLLAADTAMQKRRRRLELAAEIRTIGTVCGDCERWMKSRECPRERNVNGWNRGPSDASPVGSCPSFALSSSARQRRIELQKNTDHA